MIGRTASLLVTCLALMVPSGVRAQDGCAPIAASLVFCATTPGWQVVTAPSDGTLASFYNANSNLSVSAVAKPTGVPGGPTADQTGLFMGRLTSTMAKSQAEQMRIKSGGFEKFNGVEVFSVYYAAYMLEQPDALFFSVLSAFPNGDDLVLIEVAATQPREETLPEMSDVQAAELKSVLAMMIPTEAAHD